MEYIYIALALSKMGKKINEANIKEMLAAINKEPDEIELRALMTLIVALEKGKIKKVEREEDKSSLVQRLEKVEAKLLNIERYLRKMRKLASPKFTKVPLSTESVKSKVKERVPIAPAESMKVESAIHAKSEGIYLYGVADGGVSISLDNIGIEDCKVYTIPYKKICAIAHNCPLEPYTSDDDEEVKEWVQSHQKVLDVAQKKFTTILPLGFDTIIKPKDNTNSTDVVKDWLKENYENFKTIIKKVEKKDEYGVQVYYNPKVMSELISKQSEEIRKIVEEINSKPPGMAYMYKQKLEKAVKQEMEKLADKYFKEFYGEIKKHVDEIKVEKTKKVDKNKIMILNLSCLLAKEKVKDLGNELERIKNMEGLSVHFSGPWPPYSFVATLTATTAGGY